MAHSDAFVFLDDAQYSRGSYTNRVRIGRAGNSVWLTQPVKRDFGVAIFEIAFSTPGWPARHLDTLNGTYRRAAAFNETWPLVQTIWEGIPQGRLATANRHIIEALAALLDLKPQFFISSALPIGVATGDARLAKIMHSVAPEGGVYLSGEGGSAYQSPETFTSAGYELRYTSFQHPEYVRGDEPFIAGLSVLDALFHSGVDATRHLVGST
jgi:hypothetical protein